MRLVIGRERTLGDSGAFILANDPCFKGRRTSKGLKTSACNRPRAVLKSNSREKWL